MRGIGCVRVSALLATLCAPLGAAVPVGVEFQVNTFTPTAQNDPGVALADDGKFVVVWSSFYQILADNFDIWGQRFDASGARVGVEFIVESFTPSQSMHPEVATDADGDFVVAWQGSSAAGTGIIGQRFASNGERQGTEFLVHTYVTSSKLEASAAMEANGDFVIVWASYQDNLGLFSGLGIFGQRFASSGDRIGTEFQVHTFRTQEQRNPSVSADDDGDFVVAWHSYLQDGSFRGVFAQRFSSDGARVAAEFRANTVTSSAQEYPSVALDPDGDFLVVWQSFQDGSSTGVFGQRFASSGDRIGGEFQINTHTFQDQARAVAAAGPDGEFVVVWQSRFAQDGSGGGSFARRVSLASGLVGAEFQINTYTPDYQIRPFVGMRPGGDFVVVWHSKNQDGANNYSIFGQRFSETGPPTPTSTPTPSVTTTPSSTPTPSRTSTPTRTPSVTPSGTPPTPTPTFTPGGMEGDIDGDGQGEALTDGLLIVRYIFGFRGASLIAGAFDPMDCDRCEAGQIEAYLASLGTQMDADGDTQLDPLTDGLLILRYLFGFRNVALTQSAVDLDECSRCIAAEIEPFIASLLD
jgi:hypothetical protein